MRTRVIIVGKVIGIKMTEHPILFSGEMVRAILENRKTQTRRVIKPQPAIRNVKQDCHRFCQRCHECDDFRCCDNTAIRDQGLEKCPYGTVGDRLWVRETFLKSGGKNNLDFIEYRADNPCAVVVRWSNPMMMPRWASRITIEITNIRVEHVQDISEEDAIAEGMITHHFESPTKGSIGYPNKIKVARFPVGQFAKLWNSINAKRGYGWDKNPWVWMITFKRIK